MVSIVRQYLLWRIYEKLRHKFKCFDVFDNSTIIYNSNNIGDISHILDIFDNYGNIYQGVFKKN